MMTIEEKAKAYDEALGRAKASYGTGAYDDATTEFIFPEITETDSKDERIRKILIDAFEKKNNSFIDELVDCRLTKADILEWLEKQKEQEIVEAKDICVRKMVDKYRCTEEYDNEGNLKGKPVNCMIRAYEQGIRDILKIVKQKPAEWSEDDENYYDTIVRKLQVIGEDSGLTRNQIQFLSEHNPCDFEVEIEKAYKNADEVQYRKGFKDGVDSVKPLEWTEEDDVMVEDIIDAIPTDYAASDYKEMVSWLRLKLKYFRPAPHIKSVDYENI